MKRYILLTVMAMVLGACAQVAKITDKSTSHTKTGDQVGDVNAEAQRLKLRVLDEETRRKLGLNTDDILTVLSNDATKTRDRLIYISKDMSEDLSEGFTATPAEFLQSKKLWKLFQIFGLRSSTKHVVCMERPDGIGGTIDWPQPPCPL